MATRTISTKLAIEGESAYRQAISNINSELSKHQTQLKLVESQYQNHQNSLEALRAKEAALSDIQKDLTAKIAECKAGFQNAQSALQAYKTRHTELESALSRNKNAVSQLSTETKAAGTKWADYYEKVQTAQEKLKKLSESTEDTSAQEEKLKAQIAAAQEAMAKLEAETGGAAKTAGELIVEQRSLNNELELNEASQDACTKAMNSYEAQQNKTQIQLNNTTAAQEKNTQYIKEAESAADGCATSIDQYGNSVKEAGDKTGEMANSLQSMYSMLISAGLLRAVKQLSSALLDCATAAGDFDYQMSTVEALSGATADEMTKLTAAAKEMGATTAFTANEAGEALEYMALAGWSADEMLDGLAGIMNLAAAAGEDLGTTCDIVTDALTAFGLSASDSAHFADVLAQAASSSNTTVSQLGEAFQQVGTTAGTLGYSIDDVSVALGAMANSGLKGSTAGTALATALTRMSGANSTVTKAMEALSEQTGITISMFDETTGETKELSEFLDDLRAAFATLTDQEKMEYAANLAGQKGMKALLAIVNSSEDDWNNLTAAISASSGAAEEMANTKLDNYAGQITLLESAMDGLTISIGNALTPALGSLAEMATGILNDITVFVDEHPGVVAAVTAITVALATFTVGIAAATIGMKALTAVMTTFAESPFALGLTLVITAVAALTAGIITLAGTMEAQLAAEHTAAAEAEALAEKMDELRESYASAKEEIADNAAYINALVKQLKSLATQSELSEADEQRLLNIVEQLNDAVPGLSLAYDEETGSLNMTTEAIGEMVAAQNEAAEYAADLENMNNLYDRQAEITAQLEEVQEAYNAAVEERDRLLSENSMAAWTREYTEAYRAVTDNAEAIESLNEQLDECNAELEEAKSKVGGYIEAQTEVTDTTALVELAVANLAEDLISLQEEYNDVRTAALDSIQTQMNLWDEADEVVAMSSEDIMNAIDSQIEYWANYADNLESLMGRNIDGLMDFVDAIDDGSAESAAYIAGMVDMSDEELTALMERYGYLTAEQDRTADDVAEVATRYTQTVDEMVGEVADAINNLDLSEEAEEAAVNTLKGYRTGIDEESDETEEEIEGVADDIIEKFKGKLDEHSPSLVFREIGENTLLGYVEGVNAEEDNVLSTMEELAAGAIEAFQAESNDDTLVNAGSDTIQGYISGVNSKSSSTKTTLQDLAKTVISNFQKNSTSTSLKSTGSSTIQGYIDGANSKQTTATSKMQTIATQAITKFKNNSTSSSLSATGTNTIQGYINAVAAQQSKATAKMQTIATKSISSFTSYSTSSSLYSAGSNTIQGYINGIANKASALYSKMQSIANSAIAKFKAALGISSPSKVFMELAGYTAEGYTEGIEKNKASVTAAMAEMAMSAYSAYKDAMQTNAATAEYATAMYASSGDITTASSATSADNTIVRAEIPIYLNGGYTKTEIIEIALSGITKRQTAILASKGTTS